MEEEKSLHYLQWHITHECNLRCSHCYQEDYNHHMSLAECIEVLNRYERFLCRQGLQGQINLTGGEPLLHPDFFSLAEEIKKRNIHLGILTNGTLIDDSLAEHLALLHPVFVQISLDGTQRIHDEIRGIGNFEKAVNGIDSLKAKKIKVLVSFTAQKINFREFPTLVSFCKKHQVDKLWWDRVVTDSEQTQKEQALSTQQFHWLVNETNRLRKKYRRLNGKSFVDNHRSLQFLESKEKSGYLCSAGKSLLVLLADGQLMACRRLPFIIGSITDGEIEEIIGESEIMQKLSLGKIPKGCANCKKLPICGGGAKCVTYAQTKKLFTRDVNCFMI